MVKEFAGSLLRNATGVVARVTCVMGLVALNIAIAASTTNAQVRDDSCTQYAGTGICWCDQGPIQECAFDSDCLQIYGACTTNPE